LPQLSIFGVIPQGIAPMDAARTTTAVTKKRLFGPMLKDGPTVLLRTSGGLSPYDAGMFVTAPCPVANRWTQGGLANQ
jgi:hypothetical protein